jgi:hypothetical protein
VLKVVSEIYIYLEVYSISNVLKVVREIYIYLEVYSISNVLKGVSEIYIYLFNTYRWISSIPLGRCKSH